MILSVSPLYFTGYFSVFALINDSIFANALLSDIVEIPYLNLHPIFVYQCSFASVNQICLIQEVEQWTSVYIYSAYQRH